MAWQARPGETVLDLCAGAGGKTLLLAASMENRGVLYAYDPDRGRLERLRLRAERAGVRNLKILNAPPTGLLADRVLVDAPCSALGALRRGPDQRFHLKPSSWAKLPDQQGEILKLAATQTVPGGLLVYATCTVRREENEKVSETFLRSHADFTGVNPPSWASPFEEQVGPGEASVFRCLPHRHGTDGFFAALFRRGGSHRTQS